MLFKRKRQIDKKITDKNQPANRQVVNQQLPPWDEIVEIMQKKGLNFIDCEVVDVLVSSNKMHRCVITKSRDGHFSYGFEHLEKFDEAELCFLSPNELPACWAPSANEFRSIFADIESLLRDLKASPEYKTYFEKPLT